MMDKAKAFLVFAVAAALVLAGCTSNKYVPCCAKEGIMDLETKEIYDNPVCDITGANPAQISTDCINDEALIGQNAILCKLTGCASIAERRICEKSGCIWKDNACTTQKCGEIASKSDCEGLRCVWNEADGKCGPESSLAYSLMPICIDDAPKSCVNDRCSAMMCGYTSIKPSPPPSSQDWDINNPEKVMSKKESSTPVLNLQGSTCKFEKMTNKLFSQVKSSKGTLWVNSFRFGVGKTFSDFEQARNFFPASDRFCTSGILPGQRDRFTNYLNAPATWCAPVEATISSPIYNCPTNNLNFTLLSECANYCGGAAGNCESILGMDPPGQAQQYKCAETKIAYSGEALCKANCEILSNPKACTDNPSEFPFLLPDGRYAQKYVSDYLVDAWNPDGDTKDEFYDVCTNKMTNSEASFDYSGWEGEHDNCNDYNPWEAAIGNFNMDTYFGTHRQSALDFDYEYYRDALKTQYSGMDQNNQLPFECAGSMECISGTCDTDHYQRTLFNYYDPAEPEKRTMDANCALRTVDGGQKYLDCASSFSYSQWYGSYGNFKLSTWRSLYDVAGGDAVQSTWGALFLGEGSTGSKKYYRYYVLDDPGHEDVFEKCGIPAMYFGENQYKDACIYYDGVADAFIISHDGVGSQGSQCPNADSMPSYVSTHLYIMVTPNVVRLKAYDVDFGQNSYGITQHTVDDETFETWGNCKIEGRSRNPYLNVTELGWCAGCTYSTMAVQPIRWGGWNTYPSYSNGDPNAFSGYMKYDACYEWRGEYKYNVFDALNPQNFIANPTKVSNIRSARSPPQLDVSTAWVRESKEGSGTDGNINRGSWVSGNAMPFAGTADGYSCTDEWQSGSWWPRDAVPNPSAPYLKEKLSSYLQSNIMPVLDVLPSRTKEAPDRQIFEYKCPPGSPSGSIPCTPGSTCGAVSGDGMEQYYYCTRYSMGWVFKNGYDPLSICSSDAYGANGAAIYAIGSTGELAAQSGQGVIVNEGAAPFDSAFISRYGLTTQVSSWALNDVYSASGAAGIAARATLLKKKCKIPPMAGVSLSGSADLSTQVKMEDKLAELVGSDLMNRDSAERGALHRFFYNDPVTFTYQYNVRNAKADTYSNNVDMFLQSWEPMCTGSGSIDDRIEREFELRMNFSRALASNFSKPSLIWRFHFPDESQCDEGGSGDYDKFSEYLFTHIGDMVDASIIGLIYDSWGSENGLGYGEPIIDKGSPDIYPTYLETGESEGALDTIDGKSEAFCNIQKHSARVIGLQKYTYGQKLFAQNATCECVKCTDADYTLGLCEKFGATNPVQLRADTNQLYCNDGTQCEMPLDQFGEPSTQPPYDEYWLYRCPSMCLNQSACTLCGMDTLSRSSFCKIDMSDGTSIYDTKPYTGISDLYWEFVAGLPARDKCCLESEKPEEAGKIYTYTSIYGSKQQSEFLQYPRRGEIGIDCGRVPDTSLLQYCGITIPISQKQFKCSRV